MRKVYQATPHNPYVVLSGEARDANGFLSMSPTIENTMGLAPTKQSYKYEVEAGAINIFDEPVSGLIYISGGEYWIHSESVSKVNIEDYIEFAVIDRDNVTGIFALTCYQCGYVRTSEQMYSPCPECGSQDRLPPGSGIVTLSKFVRKDYVDFGNAADGLHNQCFEGIKGMSAVTDGLYMRTIYVSFGTENITMKTRIYSYEQATPRIIE
jgi:hypothetical protein